MLLTLDFSFRRLPFTARKVEHYRDNFTIEAIILLEYLYILPKIFKKHLKFSEIHSSGLNMHFTTFLKAYFSADFGVCCILRYMSICFAVV